MKMNNYQKFVLLLQNYLKENMRADDEDIRKISEKFLADMKEASQNSAGDNYLYNGERKLAIVKMDDFTDFYRQVKK